jgi:hypothetical protein
LHGKLEYSGKIAQSIPKKEPDLADIAKNIIEEPNTENKEKLSPDIKQTNPSFGESLGVNDESSDMKSDENEQTVESGTGQDGVSEGEEITRTSATNTSDDNSQPSSNISDDILSNSEKAEESILNSDEFPDEDDDKFEQPKIISQTLGEILVSQQKYVEAKAVFEALKEKQPDNKALDLKIEYLDRIIGLEKKGKS